MEPEDAAPSGSRLEEWFWFLGAATFPLFSTSALRLRATVWPAPVPFVLLASATTCGLWRLWKNQPGFLRRALASHRWMAAAAILLVSWHVASLGWAGNLFLAMREVTKLATGLAVAAGIALCFPRRPDFLGRFWTVVLAASVAWLAFSIYRQAVDFKAIFLSTDIDRVRPSRGYVGAYLAGLMPVCVAYVWRGRQIPAGLLALLVLTTAWIYTGSRGSWISAMVATIILVRWHFSQTGDRVRWARTFAWWALAGLVGLQAVTALIGKPIAAPRRFEYLYSPSSISELRSYRVRIHLIKNALACYWTSPWRGVGLFNTKPCIEALPDYGETHNDYANILAELGVPGLVSLLLLLLLAARSMCRGALRARHWAVSASAAACLALLIYSNVMDRVYTTPLFWCTLGLALGGARISHR